MKLAWILSAVVSPIVFALVALIVLKHYGIVNPRIVSIVIVSSLALSIGNSVLIIIKIAKG